MDLAWRDWIKGGYERTHGTYVAQEVAAVRASCAEDMLRYGWSVRLVALAFKVKVEAVLKLRASLS